MGARNLFHVAVYFIGLCLNMIHKKAPARESGSITSYIQKLFRLR